MTWEEVGAVALALPGVEASTSYGTPAFKVKKALLVRLKEDGASVVLFVGLDEKEMLLEAAPEIFFQTPHYAGYPAILARLEPLTDAELAPILQRTWRAKAPRSLQRDIPNPRPSGHTSGSRSRGQTDS